MSIDKEIVAKVYYLSFATDSKFLGCCYVRALSPEHAVLRTWEMKFNPGGQVMIMGPIAPDQVPGRAVFDRLLSAIEAEIIAPSLSLEQAREAGWNPEDGFNTPVTRMDDESEDADAADG